MLESDSPKYFTVREFAAKNKTQGTWPNSESAIWAIRMDSPKNGFGDVFVKIGRRVLINEKKFWQALEKIEK